MNPEQEIEQLEGMIDQLLAGIMDALQAGEVLSDDFQGMLAQELGLTLQRIDQLKQEVGQEREQSAQTGSQINNQPSADAELLWFLSGQQEDAFLSYLREYRTPSTQQLIDNPTLLTQTMTQLNSMYPSGQPPMIDGIPHADLNSSNVWGSKYDPQSGKMTVRFQGGSEYEYDGVPANIYRAFSKGNASAKTKGKNQYGEWWPNKNPSLGAALNQYIKAGKFNYRKIR